MSSQGAEDGWTRVIRRENRGPRHVRVSKEDESESEGKTAEGRPNSSPTLHVDDIRRHHEAIRAEWLASECCQALNKLVANHTEAHRTVTRAICLGPGSFDPATGSWAARRAAHMQVEAFRSLVAALGG